MIFEGTTSHDPAAFAALSEQSPKFFAGKPRVDEGIETHEFHGGRVVDNQWCSALYSTGWANRLVSPGI